VLRKLARYRIEQAVIPPSALSLLQPAADIAGYPRESFIVDLLDEHLKEVRGA
jgi:5-methyltetrahydropteroyltriglutamate--homocysteine methyltransferase